MAKVNTPAFRVGYPNVFKPKKNELNGQNEFSVVALFKKGENLDKLKAVAQEAIVAKWGKDKNQWPTNLRSPFRDQADRAKTIEGKRVLPQGYEDGAIYLNLKSRQAPGVVNGNLDAIIEESEFYAGCFAIASVNAYAYDNKGNRGVSFGLINLQKVKEGDPLGNRTRPTDDFVAVATEESTQAATDLFN
jgi:hypothetical protein